MPDDEALLRNVKHSPHAANVKHSLREQGGFRSIRSARSRGLEMKPSLSAAASRQRLRTKAAVEASPCTAKRFIFFPVPLPISFSGIGKSVDRMLKYILRSPFTVIFRSGREEAVLNLLRFFQAWIENFLKLQKTILPTGKS